jgi:hypothetical protein
MTLLRRQGLGFVLGLFVAWLVMPSLYAQPRRTGKTATLLTTDLGGWCDGKEVTVELNEFGPIRADDCRLVFPRATLLEHQSRTSLQIGVKIIGRWLHTRDGADLGS